MPKIIKGLAGRKPPEPVAGHSVIDDWFERVIPNVQPIVKALDTSICATVPRLHYSSFRNRAYYGRPDLGWIIELAPYYVSVNAVFFGGADFDRPPPLGDTDRTRYVKIKSLEEARLPELTDWLEQAARTRGWM